VDERSEVSYLRVLAIALLVLGAWCAWGSHLIWRHRFDESRYATGLQVAWHGWKAVLPFVILAAAQWVLPRRRTAMAALCIAIALVTAIGLFGYRADARSSGHGPDLRFLWPTREYSQLWLATLGALVAATLARWQSADSRRP
jgi:hypothetical protein